jgi:DNA-binding transcriptional LysR family regulator
MHINNIDLRQLRYFIAVAEELNFSRAAERLNMSQPPLSLTIKALEEELNTVLFKRTKRKVELTSAGAYLLQSASALLRQMEDTVLYTQAAGRGDVGELRVGTNFSSLLNPRFIELMSEFHRKYPNIRVVLKEMVIEESLKSLAAQQSDLCFVWPYSLSNRGDIKFELFSQESLHLCMSVDHPLAKRKSIKTSDLKPI